MEPRPLDTDAQDQIERGDSRTPRKAYTTPRLTKHGSIVTQTATGDTRDSGIVSTSDRALKEGLAPVDPRQVLAEVVGLPMTTWSYKGETVRHLGPMAQDFSAAFGLGADDRHIHTVDASGVALAAIQGLHALVQVQAARLAGFEHEIDALRTEIRANRVDARDTVSIA